MIFERSASTKTALGIDARSIEERTASPNSNTRGLARPSSLRAALIELVPKSIHRIPDLDGMKFPRQLAYGAWNGDTAAIKSTLELPSDRFSTMPGLMIVTLLGGTDDVSCR